jgi:polyhydroxyalkanoate synthesis regulator phasin
VSFKLEVKEFPPLKPAFLIEEAKSVLGYPKTAPIGEKIQKLVDEVRLEALSIIEPRGLYAELAVQVEDDGVRLEAGAIEYRMKSRRLVQRLKGSREAFVFIVTIGVALEEMINELIKKGEYTKALVFDAVGSAYAEGLAEEAQRFLKTLLKEREDLTPRFSPGYGDLDLESQSVFFEILKPERIGVTLKSSYAMIPRKTVTAITGKILTDEI